MNTDKQVALSEAQALTATAISTNVIDLSVTGRGFGAGEPLCIAIHVNVAADFGAADETYSFGIETDDDVAFGSATVLATRAILASALTAGSKHVLPFSPTWTFERYLALRSTLGGTTPLLTMSAWVMPLAAVESWKSYPTAGGFTN